VITVGYIILKGNTMNSSLISGIKAQYIVDNKGNKTGVILDIKLFDALLEELEDLYDIADAERIIKKKGKRYSLQEVEKILAKKE
jgi:hypothetical protein